MAITDSILGAMNAYLDRDNTEYAIMIDGAWGVGKTHFIMHSLIPARPMTKFVYVSLYGLKTIDELDAQMQTGSPEVHSVTNINSWPKIEKQAVGELYLSSQTRQASSALENANPGHSTVFCFDDLERWHGDLDLCLSYVNRLVEHEKQKCILIGNLDEMSAQAAHIFSSGREKTIRYIYRYDSDYHTILDVSLDLVDYSNQTSKEFLSSIVKNNFSSLERLFEDVAVRNIRIIADAFQLFEYIYQHNGNQFNRSRNLAFTYLMALCSVLILVSRYLVDKKDRDKLLKGNHADNKGFKFLSDIGYFEDQALGSMSTRFRQLLDTTFYRLDQISLKGLCSIVSNGYYIKEDFAGDFDGWTTAQQYDLYLDKNRFYQLTDHEAQQVFNDTLESLIENRNITNPVTLLLLAERVISDIACGVVDYNPIVFRKNFIDMVNALYDSGQMQIVEVSIFDIDGDRFRNCRGLYEHILKRNTDFDLEDQKIKMKGFWRQLFESPENIDVLLEKFHPHTVFSQAVKLEEIINALESLNNSHLHQMVEWVEAGFDNLPDQSSTSFDPDTVNAVHLALRSKYGAVTGVRANHLRQMAEIIARPSGETGL